MFFRPEDSSAVRLAQLSKMPTNKDQGIPVCEKSNSYENVTVRRSTLIPKEQKMAREMKSKEDNSKDYDRKALSSEERQSAPETRKKKSTEMATARIGAQQQQQKENNNNNSNERTKKSR
ncbi:unnamed protein product [Caenorhabditis sp. 36 PRJEB53466]|nr:unnamed protein product [Caenorhabditis sp. 36 PRJEB53466]